MKFVLGGLLAGAAIAGAHLLDYPSQTVLIVDVACIGMVLGALADILAAALQGTERIGKLALWSAVQQYISGAIAIGLLLDHKGVVVYALVVSSGSIIPIVANGYHLWPEIRGRMSIDLRLWRVIAVGGLPFLLWSAILLVYGSIDILMLQDFIRTPALREVMTSKDHRAWYLPIGLAGELGSPQLHEAYGRVFGDDYPA